MHHVSKEFMDMAIERHEEYKGSIDERFVEIIERFNQIKGVQTMWSCSGHTYEEQLESANQYSNSVGQTYITNKSDIIFVVTEEESEYLISRISNFIGAFSTNGFLKYRPQLSMFKLLSPKTTKQTIDNAQTYNALQIKLNHQLCDNDHSVYDVWYEIINHLLDTDK